MAIPSGGTSGDDTGDNGSGDTEATSDVPRGRQRARVPDEDPTDPDPTAPGGGDPAPIPDPVGADPSGDGDTDGDGTGGTQPGGGDRGDFMGDPAPIPDPVGGSQDPSPTEDPETGPGAGGTDRGDFMGDPEPVRDPVTGEDSPDPAPTGTQPDYAALERAKARDAAADRQRALQDALELDDPTDEPTATGGTLPGSALDAGDLPTGPSMVPGEINTQGAGTRALAGGIMSADIDEDIADAATRGGFSQLPLPTVPLESITRDTQELIEDREFGLTTVTVETPIGQVPVGVSADLSEEDSPDTAFDQFKEGALGVAIPTAYLQDIENIAEAADNPAIYARNPAATVETATGAGREAGEALTVAARENPYGVAGALTAGLAGVGVGAVSAVRGSGSVTRALAAEIDPRVGPFGTTLATRGIRGLRDRLPGDERGMAQLPGGRTRAPDTDVDVDADVDAETGGLMDELSGQLERFETASAIRRAKERAELRMRERFQEAPKVDDPGGDYTAPSGPGGDYTAPRGAAAAQARSRSGPTRVQQETFRADIDSGQTPGFESDIVTGPRGGLDPGILAESTLFGTRAIETARTPTVGEPTTDLDVDADGQPVPVVDPAVDADGIAAVLPGADVLLEPITAPGTVEAPDAEVDTPSDVDSDTVGDTDVFTGTDTDITLDTDQPTDVDTGQDVDQPTDVDTPQETDQPTDVDTDVPPIPPDTPFDPEQRDPRDPDRPFDPSDPPDRDIDIPVPDDDRDDRRRRRRTDIELDSDLFENPTISPEEALEFDPLED